MKRLELYFPGEESWTTYASYFREHWTDSALQLQLLKICGDRQDFASVIHFHMLEGSIVWMNSPIPALDHETPLNCLEDEILINRLKVCLMRFPC